MHLWFPYLMIAVFNILKTDIEESYSSEVETLRKKKLKNV